MEIRPTSLSPIFNQPAPSTENPEVGQLQSDRVMESILINSNLSQSIQKSVKILNNNQPITCFPPILTKNYQLKDIPWLFRQPGNIIDFSPNGIAVGLRNTVYLFISHKIKTYLLPNFIIWPEIKWIKWISTNHLAVCAYYETLGCLNENRTFILNINNDTDPWIKINSYESFMNPFNDDTLLIGHSTILKTTEDNSYELIKTNPFFTEKNLFCLYKQPKNERIIIYDEGRDSKIALYTNSFEPIGDIAKFKNRFLNPNSITWDSEERFIAFPSDDPDDTAIVIWDSEKMDQAFCIPTSGIVDALWWINNTLLCTVTVSSSDEEHGEIQAWEVNPHNKTATLLHSTNVGEKIFSENLSSNKKLLITIGNDGMMKWWDVSCLKPRSDIKLFDLIARSINIESNSTVFS